MTDGRDAASGTADIDGEASSGGSSGRRFPADNLGQLRPDTGLFGRLKHGFGRVRGFFLGDQRHFPIRMLSLFVMVCFGLLAVSVYAFIQAEADPYMQSGGLIRSVVQFITNPWVYATVVLGGLVVLKLFLADYLGRQTASRTRFSKQTVKRFAAEVSTTDGCTRLIGTSDHSQEDLRRKLEYALVNDDAVSDELPDRYDEEMPLADDEDADVGVAGALLAPDHHNEGAGDDYDLEEAAPAGFPDVQTAVEAAAGDAERVAMAVGPFVPLGARETPTADTAAASATSADATEDAGDRDARQDEDGPREWEPRTLREQVRLLRMDAATAMSWSELLRRFVLPAGVTTFVSFAVAGSMWLHPLLYVAIGALSLTVGAGTYMVTKASRRRRVKQLRREREVEPMNSANMLVKPVRTPEATGYVGFLPGHVYFDFDRRRFVRKVGRRWYQAINEPEVWPSIQEKFAKRVRQYMPTIREMERNDARDGRVAIYNDMADVIRSAENPDGIIPKRTLGERVVRAGPDGGHDPELVAQAYRELYQVAWQEVDVQVPDADGEVHEMTMVHLRGQPIQDDVARLMANYSREFDPHREARYPLPDVDQPPAVDPVAMTNDTPATSTVGPDPVPAPGVDADAGGTAPTRGEGD